MTAALESLQKTFGASIHRGSEVAPVERLSTGSIVLDWAIGGGFPRGRISEVFGKEAVGKTTIAYTAMAEAQKLGLGCVFINLEAGFNDEWAQKMGVDLAALILAEPAHGDQAADQLIQAVKTEGVHLVVFDSIGAMMSEQELAEDGKDRVGGQSKLVTGMIKRVSPAAYQNNVAVLLLNQARDDMRSPIPGAIESPGGRALKHASSIRIELKMGKPATQLVDGQPHKQIGFRLSALVKKNQLGVPKRKAELDFIHDEVDGLPLGIHHTNEILDLSMRLNLFERSGAWFSHPLFPTKLNGRAAMGEFFETHPEALAQMRTELMTRSITKNGGTDV